VCIPQLDEAAAVTAVTTAAALCTTMADNYADVRVRCAALKFRSQIMIAVSKGLGISVSFAGLAADRTPIRSPARKRLCAFHCSAAPRSNLINDFNELTRARSTLSKDHTKKSRTSRSTSRKWANYRGERTPQILMFAVTTFAR